MVIEHDDMTYVSCYFLMGSNFENCDNNERVLGRGKWVLDGRTLATVPSERGNILFLRMRNN